MSDIGRHCIWGHALGHDASGLLLFSDFLLLLLIIDLFLLEGLLVSLNSVIEHIGMVLLSVIDLNSHVFIEIIHVYGLMVLFKLLLMLNLGHLLLKLRGFFLNLSVPIFMMLFVWPLLTGLKCDLIIELGVVDSLLNLCLIGFSLCLGLVETIKLILSLILVLLFLFFICQIELVLHEFRVSLVLGVELNHFSVKTFVKLGKINCLLIGSVTKSLLLLLFLKLLSLFLSQPDFLFLSFYLGVLLSFLLRKSHVFLDLHLVLELLSFLVDFHIPLLGVLLIVLKVEVIRRDIISVVLMRNSIIISLNQRFILELTLISLLLLGQLGLQIFLVHLIVPLFLNLVLLNIGYLVSILLVLLVHLLLKELLVIQERFTSLMLLGKFHWIISVWNVIHIILMLVVELQKIWISVNHIMLGECVEFLLVRKGLDSLDSRASGIWCVLTHVRELLNHVIIVTLMLVFALNIVDVRELFNDVVRVVLVVESVLNEVEVVLNDIVGVLSVVLQLNVSWVLAVVGLLVARLMVS